MIEDGEKTAIGVSGGKDSMTLLYALSQIRRFYPKKFELEAITVNMDFQELDFTAVYELCKDPNINYTIVESEIADIVFEYRKEYVKQLIKSLGMESPRLRERLFHAIQTSGIPGWAKPQEIRE